MRDASGCSHLQEMSCYCVRVGMRGANLNTFPHVFTRSLCVWNAVLFSASVSNAAARAFWGPAVSTLDGRNIWVGVMHAMFHVSCLGSPFKTFINFIGIKSYIDETEFGIQNIDCLGIKLVGNNNGVVVINMMPQDKNHRPYFDDEISFE